jgi:hypothetical protein
VAVTSRLRAHFAVWPVVALAVPLELIGLLTPVTT